MSVRVKLRLTALNRFKNNVDFTEELRKAAKRHVESSVRDNIRKSIDVDDQKFTPLKPDTLKQKKSKGYPSKPLIATGKLLRSMRTRKIGTNRVRVSVTQQHNRRKIGGYHNVGTAKLPKREFFGIRKSQMPRVIRQIKLVLIKKIDRLLR